jgi:hypothetical protein
MNAAVVVMVVDQRQFPSDQCCRVVVNPHYLHQNHAHRWDYLHLRHQIRSMLQ